MRELAQGVFQVAPPRRTYAAGGVGEIESKMLP
jgi:hypothetical protein